MQNVSNPQPLRRICWYPVAGTSRIPNATVQGPNTIASVAQHAAAHTREATDKICIRGPEYDSGHAMPYHYHFDLSCDYNTNLNTVHSPLTGFALDGKGFYGKYEDSNGIPTDLDYCNGHYGPVPADPDLGVPANTCMYHYHASDAKPFTVACYGPVTTKAECDALFPDACGDDSTSYQQASTYQGSVTTITYDKWCPCFGTSDKPTTSCLANASPATTASQPPQQGAPETTAPAQPQPVESTASPPDSDTTVSSNVQEPDTSSSGSLETDNRVSSTPNDEQAITSAPTSAALGPTTATVATTVISTTSSPPSEAPQTSLEPDQPNNNDEVPGTTAEIAASSAQVPEVKIEMTIEGTVTEEQIRPSVMKTFNVEDESLVDIQITAKEVTRRAWVSEVTVTVKAEGASATQASAYSNSLKTNLEADQGLTVSSISVEVAESETTPTSPSGDLDSSAMQLLDSSIITSLGVFVALAWLA
mmetsp:Transcript_27209/g.42546  ORF Transcript_27209/g.42546 Transcript_27209/m.42546 type:complete len:477 (-) Transcript_27209:1274-2704(-)